MFFGPPEKPPAEKLKELNQSYQKMAEEKN
jgi:hypothetical protein